MNHVLKSWKKFNEDAKETMGAGAIPFAVLAQCFQRHWGWKLLGVVLTVPMLIMGLVTVPIAALFALAHLLFLPVRLFSSGIQELLEVKDSRPELNQNQWSSTLSWKKTVEDMGETLRAGTRIPNQILMKCYKSEYILMKLLGVLITIPMIIINIVTGVFAITFALAQLVFFPVRGLSAVIQDFLGPSSLDANVSATCCPFGENTLDSNISLYRLPCRVRQFKVSPEEKSIQTQSEDEAHLTKHLLPS